MTYFHPRITAADNRELLFAQDGQRVCVLELHSKSMSMVTYTFLNDNLERRSPSDGTHLKVTFPSLMTPRWDRKYFRYYCVCVCFLPIHSRNQVRWTYQPGSRRISHPPSFCGARLNFSREKDSAIPFPRRPWSRILCTNDLIVLYPLGIF